MTLHFGTRHGCHRRADGRHPADRSGLRRQGGGAGPDTVTPQVGRVAAAAGILYLLSRAGEAGMPFATCDPGSGEAATRSRKRRSRPSERPGSSSVRGTTGSSRIADDPRPDDGLGPYAKPQSRCRGRGRPRAEPRHSPSMRTNPAAPRRRSHRNSDRIDRWRDPGHLASDVCVRSSAGCSHRSRRSERRQAGGEPSGLSPSPGSTCSAASSCGPLPTAAHSPS